MKTIGIIGGSGLYEIEGLGDIEQVSVDTPWGKPSGELVTGTLGDTRMVFLPRHGKGHKIMPSDINYRANIYALKTLGVEWIVSVSAVGSMREDIEPGHVVIPKQFIDHTKSRQSSFFGSGVVAHVSMADPVCPVLAEALYKASSEHGAIVHRGGVYICIEGPQFSTRAESNLYRSWGVDVIGMTNMPEAKLAREAEICYSTLALSTDYDCWHTEHDDVTVEDLIETLNKNVSLAKEVIASVPGIIQGSRQCVCASALRDAIITPSEEISISDKQQLGILIGRYVK